MHRPVAHRSQHRRQRPGVAVLALLWLLIALMPLRALSQELMGAAQRAADASQVSMAAMPCHAGPGHIGVDGASHPPTSASGAASTAATADSVDDAAVGSVATTDEPAPNCNACDLCHAALAGPVPAAQDLSVPPALDRSATPAGPSAAVAPDGIFKPPRG